MTWSAYLSDGVETLELSKANGFVLQGVNTSYPDVRRNRQTLPNQSGAIDQTTYFGDRPVTLNIGIAHELSPFDSDQKVLDQLRAWMLPSLRYYLFLTDGSTGQLRRYRVRPNSMGARYSAESPSQFTVETVQWIAMDGISEDPAEQIVQISRGTDSELGRPYDLTFDRTYPPSGVIGEAIVHQNGTAPAWPALRIFGPCTGPRLTNLTIGKMFKMDDAFELLDGEYLEVNMSSGTVLLDGVAANSRYSSLDFSLNEWWQLAPGNNLLRYDAVLSAPPSVIEVTYRHTYL